MLLRGSPAPPTTRPGVPGCPPHPARVLTARAWLWPTSSWPRVPGLGARKQSRHYHHSYIALLNPDFFPLKCESLLSLHRNKSPAGGDSDTQHLAGPHHRKVAVDMGASWPLQREASGQWPGLSPAYRRTRGRVTGLRPAHKLLLQVLGAVHTQGTPGGPARSGCHTGAALASEARAAGSASAVTGTPSSVTGRPGWPGRARRGQGPPTAGCGRPPWAEKARGVASAPVSGTGRSPPAALGRVGKART